MIPKPGDVVALKQGSFLMTVEKVRDVLGLPGIPPLVDALWFFEGKLQRGTFSSDALDVWTKVE